MKFARMAMLAVGVAAITGIAVPEARTTATPAIAVLHEQGDAVFRRTHAEGPPARRAVVPVVRLRIYRGTFDDAIALDARRTAESILERAGVAVGWADCTGAHHVRWRPIRAGDEGPDEPRSGNQPWSGDSRCAPGATAGTVVVWLVDDAALLTPGGCAESTRRRTRSGGVISVRLGCIRGLLAGVDAGVELPEGITPLTEGSLVGMLIAHEIGHLLGARHSRTGLMRKELTETELLALMAGTLSFNEAEGQRLRAGAVTLDRLTTVTQ